MKEEKTTRKKLGALGEEAAAAYLAAEGSIRILSRNWRCRTGELDIIGDDNETIVFVEVRTRSSQNAFGTPQESVDWRKQRQIAETAQVYLYQTRQLHRQIRFDVVSVLMDKRGTMLHIEYIRNAF